MTTPDPSEPVHYLTSSPDTILPAHKAQYQAVVYHTLCGQDWKAISDIQERVTCAECLKMLRGKEG